MDPETLAALRDIATRRGLRLCLVGESARSETGRSETGTVIRLLSTIPRPDGQILTIELAGVRREVELKLPGRFQADNVLMAAVLADALGVRDVLDRLPMLTGVRGRMELAARLANGAAVYVDYAHTPDALERLLTALRPHTSGRLHVVFGAGGDRDRGKRPLMGAAAGRYADVVIVTDDNPRGEDPATIRAAVLAGVCANGSTAPTVGAKEIGTREIGTREIGAREIGDRALAIAAALEDLRPGDVLAVAGKGHEQGQTIGGTVIPFDDVTVVRRLIGQRGGNA
jgi:UDP-N-acetylmuramoyl-L-alanyl-D-glutamate--2,6-diaminopimelate ligase